MDQQLIRDTQTMLKGPPLVLKRGPLSKSLDLETILEVTSSQEQDGNLGMSTLLNELKKCYLG